MGRFFCTTSCSYWYWGILRGPRLYQLILRPPGILVESWNHRSVRIRKEGKGRLPCVSVEAFKRRLGARTPAIFITATHSLNKADIFRRATGNFPRAFSHSQRYPLLKTRPQYTTNIIIYFWCCSLLSTKSTEVITEVSQFRTYEPWL